MKFLLALVLAVSCSDSTPTSPSSASPSFANIAPSSAFPAGTVLRIVSGAAGTPVGGAEVEVGGTFYETDATGRLTLSTGVERDTRLDIAAHGFLDRETLLRTPDSTRLTLWPREHSSAITEEFTRNIVYGGPGALHGLIRLPLGESDAYVVPSQQIRNDVRAIRAVNTAAANFGKATRGELRFIVTERPPSGAVVFDLEVDPNHPDVVGQVLIFLSNLRTVPRARLSC